MRGGVPHIRGVAREERETGEEADRQTDGHYVPNTTQTILIDLKTIIQPLLGKWLACVVLSYWDLFLSRLITQRSKGAKTRPQPASYISWLHAS